MNYFKNLMLCIIIASTSGIVAVNKQQIRLSNQYGQDVMVYLRWRKKGIVNEYRYTDLILKSDRMVKAPISGYKLANFEVTPAVNLSGLVIGLGGYAITHSLNSHKQKAGNNRHFIIKAEKHASKIASQKQITVIGMSEEEYNKVVGKNVAKVADVKSETSNPEAA